jgi:hypothetical protein
MSLQVEKPRLEEHVKLKLKFGNVVGADYVTILDLGFAPCHRYRSPPNNTGCIAFHLRH